MNTPRTDANESITCKEGDLCIAPDFARQLERELITMSALADRLAEAMKGLVAVNENHNEAISKLIGKPLGWKDAYLDASREALTIYENHKKGNTP